MFPLALWLVVGIATVDIRRIFKVHATQAAGNNRSKKF